MGRSLVTTLDVLEDDKEDLGGVEPRGEGPLAEDDGVEDEIVLFVRSLEALNRRLAGFRGLFSQRIRIEKSGIGTDDFSTKR